MSSTGTCMLCRTVNVDLIDSHIVSRWIYRRILEYAPAAGPQGIAVADGRAGYSGKQLSTYLLCRPCEDLLGDWESYAASISLQDDSMTFPILNSAAILMARSDTAVGQLAAAGERFDLILADPPYGEKNVGRRSTSFAQQLLDEVRLPELLADGGLLVLGHTKRDTLSLPDNWLEKKLLKHGDSLMRFLGAAPGRQEMKPEE